MAKIEYNLAAGRQQQEAYERRQRQKAALEQYWEDHCICGVYNPLDESGHPQMAYCPGCGYDQMYVPNH